MEQLTMVTDEREYVPVSSEPTPEIVTVECPICHKIIDVPQYDTITRTEALKKHIEEEHSGPTGGSEFHSLMLHAVAEMYGPGGIVLDEEKAKGTPCHCVEYKPGKFWCTSPGVVGALSDEQEKIYCNPMEMIERPGIKERIGKFQSCVTKSREALPPTNGATRLELFLSSMSKCLAGEGIEA